MDETHQPLVSVITPSLNQGEFIEDNLLSVRNQEYPEVEHLVIDGGSIDNTTSILKEYQNQYRLLWTSEPDQGHAHAVNKGLTRASGEIIGWLNSDDTYFSTDVFSRVVSTFADRRDVDVLYGDIAFISRESRLLMVRCVPQCFSYRRLLRGCFISQPAVFLRRKVVERFHLDPAVKLAVDYEYWLRTSLVFRFCHLPGILAADRYYQDRRMVTNSEVLDMENQCLREKYRQGKGCFPSLIQGLDRILTGVPRRLLGLIKLGSIYQQEQFAFPLRLDPWENAVLRQLNFFRRYYYLGGLDTRKKGED